METSTQRLQGHPHTNTIESIDYQLLQIAQGRGHVLVDE
jgi:hypothetical protein